MKPVWVLVENLVQNDIGHEAYGTYASLFSLALVFSVLADWGINNYSTHKIASDNSQYNDVFNSLFFVRVIILLLYPVIMASVGYALQYTKNEIILLTLIALTQTFIYFLMFFRAKFQAFQHFKTDGFMSVIERVILIVLVLSLLNKGINLSLYIYARFIAVFIAVLISFSVVSKLYGWVKLKFSKKQIVATLKAAFPFTLMTLLYSFNERVDMVMLERMYSKHEAGLYAGAYRWYDALMMFVWLITPILFSKFAKVKGEHKEASKLFNQGFLIVSVPMLLITPFLFFDGKILFFLFSNSTDLEVFRMNRLFQVLIISFVFNAFFVVKGTFLTASGHVKKVNLIIVLGALVNVILNFIFIPKHGAFAAALSTGVSTGILGLGYYILVVLSRLTINFKKIGGVFIAFVLSCFIYFILMINKIHFTMYFGISILIFVFVLFMFGVFSKSKNNG